MYDINAVGSFHDLLATADALSGGLYIALGLLGLWVIAFLTLKMRWPFGVSFSAASFVTFIGATLLHIAGVAPASYPSTAFAAVLVGILVQYLSERG